MAELVPEERRQAAISFMTTEHFALQGARGLTTSESNGRAALFLGSLSSSLVALGFAATASDFGRSFNVFALLILPPIAFLGFVTFQRAVQSGVDDETYSRGINRIRHFYVEMVPELQPYFVQSTTDEGITSVALRTARGAQWQTFLTVASVVGVMTSVVIGATVGLAVNFFAEPDLGISVAVGVVIALLAVAAHMRYQSRAWKEALLATPTQFPRQPVLPGA